MSVQVGTFRRCRKITTVDVGDLVTGNEANYF